MQEDSKNKIKKFAGHTVVYGLGDALYKGIAFFLLPIYLKYLSPTDYGVLETITVTRELAIAFLAMGIPSALLKYYHSKVNKSLVVSTAFWSYLILQLPIIICLFLYSTNLSNIIFDTNRYALCFSILSLNVSLISFRTIPLTLYRAQSKSVKYSVVTFLVALVTLLSNIYFVAVLRMGVEGVLWGNFMGGATGLLLVLMDIRNSIQFKFKIDLLKRMLRYSTPIALSALPLNIIFMNDRYFLSHFCSLDELGRYALASKFSRLLLVFFITPFQLSWVPFILENQGSPNYKRILAKIGSTFYYLGLNVLVLICLFAPVAVRVIAPPTYWEACYAIPFLCFSVLIYGIGFVFRAGILVSEQTGVITRIMLAGLMINILTNFYLIPNFGLYGASTSLLVCFSLIALISFNEGKKRLQINYPITKMAIITIGSMTVILIYYTVFYFLHELYYQITAAILIWIIFIYLNCLGKIFNFKSAVFIVSPKKIFTNENTGKK